MLSRRRPLALWLFTGGGLLVSTPHMDAQALNVKLGLWEVTSTSQTSGAPPIDTSKMTPEQRARLEGALKARQDSAPAGRTRRSCVTKEQLEKNPFQRMQDESCKRTAISNTSSLQAFTFECAGKRTTSGQMRFEAVTPESVKGTFRITTSDGTRQMTVNSTMTAKWIGASCGDVK